MERTKLLTIAVVGLLLLNLITVGILLFRPGPRPGRGDGDGPARVIIQRLHFNEAQQRTYRQLVTEHQRQTRALMRESVRLYQTYYGLLASPTPDTAQANALSQQIGVNQRAMAQLNFSHFGQIKALCRSDQQADFARLVTELSQLFGRQQGPDRPPPDGPNSEDPENRPMRP